MTLSALLSLSKSMPSKNSQDSLENSELLPIGKKTVDAALVPICLNTEDVNNKIAKLKRILVRERYSVQFLQNLIVCRLIT